MRMPDIKKIVITGGPCAGKTTALSWLQNAFTRKGYAVLFVPETATELIGGGVSPWTCGSNADYQLCQVRLQVAKERIFEDAARTMPQEKVLIVCDRGVMDNKAYMTDQEFHAILQKLGLTEVGVRDQYDGVFHLVTAANGAESFYTTQNNTARRESPEEAAAMDDKILAAWTGHPHLRVIGNETDFQGKMMRLLAEVDACLGEPGPLETERKYLIAYPDIQWLESQPACRRVEIIQTYLRSDEDEEIRVRQRGSEGNYVYYKTTKRRLSAGKRVEIEERLTQEEYLAALMDAATRCRQIRKTRYCLTWQEEYLEIDIYPFWQDRAILEIELSQEDAPVSFPEELQVIREVTEDETYSNRSLAHSIPEEI